ncbi:hypothetical protein ACTFIU_007953 [Dictyostelium citrinum]
MNNNTYILVYGHEFCKDRIDRDGNIKNRKQHEKHVHLGFPQLCKKEFHSIKEPTTTTILLGHGQYLPTLTSTITSVSNHLGGVATIEGSSLSSTIAPIITINCSFEAPGSNPQFSLQLSLYS